MINLHAVRSSGADLFVGGSGPRAQYEWSLGLLAGSGRRNFTLWRGHSLESGRGHADRRGDLGAKNVRLDSLPLRVIDKGGLLEFHALEYFELFLQRDLIVGARVEVIVCMSEVSGLRHIFVVCELVESLVVLLWLAVLHFILV